MVLFTRTMTGLPGKFFDLVAASKELQTLVKTLVGLDLSIYAASGGAVGELVSTLNFSNFAHFEEVVTALTGNPEFQHAFAKMGALSAPGARDQLLRSL